MNQGAATGAANLALGDYQQIGQQGQQQYGQYQNLLTNYLQQFGNAAGVDSGIVKAQPGTGLGGNGGGAQGNPYGLNPNQQTYVNSQVDSLKNAQQSALQAYQEHLGAQGNVNPALAAEGAAAINQHFAGLVNQTQAGAQNQIQQERVKDLGNLMNLASQQSAAGAGLQEAGASGTLGAGHLLDTVAGTGLQGSQQQSQLAMQDAATNPLGSLLSYFGNLAGPTVAGAFNSYVNGTGTNGTGNTGSTGSYAPNTPIPTAYDMNQNPVYDPTLMDPNAL